LDGGYIRMVSFYAKAAAAYRTSAYQSNRPHSPPTTQNADAPPSWRIVPLDETPRPSRDPDRRLHR
jgi:hypothetical protein